MSLATQVRKIYFVGMGGIGMSGLAELLARMGHEVSGSDLTENDNVLALKKLGVKFFKKHEAKNVEFVNPHVVVYSSAVPLNNAELIWARNQKIPIIRRAEMLAELMRMKRGIAVAGSHGKTTTTGMAALVMKQAQLEPTVVIGGRFNAIGSNVALGAGSWLLAEADESDGSFLRLAPELAVVTNIDKEHLDHYKDFSNVLEAFRDFIDRLPFYGRAILCADSPLLWQMKDTINKSVIWYGFASENNPDYLLKIIKKTLPTQFEIYSRRDGYAKAHTTIQLKVPGAHNMLNATAAYLLACELGISSELATQALCEFTGVARRFEYKGEHHGHPVIEDYAHHPTEILATLRAARDIYGEHKLTVCFQPHRFTRTRDSWEEFKDAFKDADHLFTLPIYAASEPFEPWTEFYDREYFAAHVGGVFAEDWNSAKAHIEGLIRSSRINKGDPIFVLGAGNIAQFAKILVE